MIASFFQEFWMFFNEVAIYLLFGFIVAGILHVIFPDSFVNKHFGKKSKTAVLKASLFGIPLPICSCGIIPVATSLKRKGASNGAVTSFMISTPQIGADSYMITQALIGWVFGVFRIAAAFISALSAGIFVNIFSKKEEKKEKVFNFDEVKTESENVKSRLKNIIRYIQYEVFSSIADHLIIGIIIAALISIFVPEKVFSTYLSNSFISMLIMLIVGIPMYICATSSTPIAASLIMKGMSPGAALVFLLVGPATNAITISAVSKTMGKRIVVIYLTAISVVSVLLGYLLNFISLNYDINIMNDAKIEILPDWLKLAGTSIIIVMFLIHYFNKYKSKFNFLIKNQNNSWKSIQVKGLNCNHCVNTLTKALLSLNNVTKVNIDLQHQKVSFKFKDENNSIQQVKEAIIKSGFELEEEEKKLKFNLEVLGMTCNHCVHSVKKAIKSIKGNQNIKIDLTNNDVSFTGKKNNLKETKKAIVKAGFNINE